MRWLLLFIAFTAAGRTLDLSGPWRMSSRDLPENALPSTDDSSWSTVSLPLRHTRPVPGTWLRRVVVTPAEADALVVGRLNGYDLYVDGIRQPVISSPGPNLHPVAHPRERMVIAIRIGTPNSPGPNQVTVDSGPYLLGSRPAAELALENARLRSLWRQSPFVLLAGVQITLAMALLVIWGATQRRYSALIWTAAYMVYSSHNLLRMSAFAGLPASPRYIPSILALQVALAIIGRDSPRVRLSVWSAYATVLLVVGNARPETTPYTNGTLELLAVAMVIAGVWRRDWQTRIAGFVACLYWVLPAYGAFNGTSLIIDSPVGYWPVLGMLNVPLSLSLVLLFLARFAEDRRERNRLSHEFEAARTVQHLLLPAASLSHGTLSMDVVYEPAQEVGGDFYWSQMLPGGSLLVAVGDVSGKGLKAALQVSMIIGILRNEKSHSPALILRALNDALTGQIAGGFVTCCCARFHGDMQATMANAGHPPPYSDGNEVTLQGGLPLGIAVDVEYTEAIVRGERFTLVSDGVPEAANARRELFGFDRTRAVSGKSAAEIAEAARAWGQGDDITVVTIQHAEIRRATA